MDIEILREIWDNMNWFLRAGFLAVCIICATYYGERGEE